LNTPEIVWNFPEPVQIPEDFAQHIGGHPIVAETLYRRGITTIEAADAFLDPDQYTPANPYDLPDLKIAVERLKTALKNNEKIGVWGDFDVDGQTSTSLLVDALRQLGGDVIFHIPVRATESHGIKIPFLQTFLDQGVQLLLTCDTGITAHEAIEYANSRGVPVIITDHHQLASTLPNALAAVNPQRLPPDHPLHPLCGVGCAYEVIRALYEEMAADPAHQTDPFLDLVALGTIADVAELYGDNRWLVQRGLRQIREAPRKSILALINAAEVNLSQFDEGHVGFQLAPRLNAIGRLGDANPMVDFFLSDDDQLIQVMTARLEGLNGERRFQSKQIFAGAQGLIQQDPHVLDFPVLILGHPAWIGGVVGIVASHLVEIYNRPVILLTTPPDRPASGSARSVEGIDITKAIAACQSLLNGFGGHPMAAGLSLPAEKIPEFRRMLSNAVREQAGDRPLEKTIPIDGVFKLEELTLELAKDINRLAPFGNGNPPLNFLSQGLHLQHHCQIGKNQEHRQMTVGNENGTALKFLWWQSADYPLPESPFDLAYNLRPSTFRGTEDIQLTWVEHLHQPEAQETRPTQSAISEIIDYRQHPHPLQALHAIRQQESSLLIWGENIQTEEISAVDRQQLTAADALVVWTTPPARAVLEQVCKIVSPVRIYLFNQQPGTDTISMVKAGIQAALTNKEGWISISELAALSAQTAVAIQTLLDLFLAHGNLTLLNREEDNIQLTRGGTAANKDKIAQLSAQLQYLQGEAAAYRRFYATAKPDTLLGIQAD
jgi:single-stranded-DNA-specific exonuclease